MNQRRIFKPCEEPGQASVEDGVVLLDGPDGVAVAMTPEAAEGTADSLRQAAAQARRADPGTAGRTGESNGGGESDGGGGSHPG